VAFSSDGRSLASVPVRLKTVQLWDLPGLHLGGVLHFGNSQETVQLWDAPVVTLLGHVAPVFGVTFSPDGRRIASASTDGTVKVWDTGTGQEILTLPGHVNEIKGVAFSPDGQQLASACGDGTVRIWDARPLLPDVLTTREAMSIVEFLLARKVPAGEILARIKGDPTIADEVRQRALELAEPRVQALLVNDEADRLVRSRFDKLVLKEDVLESLRVDAAVGEAVRRQAMALAGHFSDDPNRLHRAAWSVLRQPDGDASLYRRALRMAEALHRLVPNTGLALTTLGVAQYRAGNHQQAEITLTRSGQLNSGDLGSPMPEDLAFLALAQHRSGHTEKARDTLNRLRQAKKPQWAKNQEAQAFLREVEAIEQDLAFPADPFAP
jgi:hypothetical protein